MLYHLLLFAPGSTSPVTVTVMFVAAAAGTRAMSSLSMLYTQRLVASALSQLPASSYCQALVVIPATPLVNTISLVNCPARS
ncbi:MAG: hypothetical protein N3A53_04980 [Verrucomicrobiae bacterium]|nr:hypothetical protein [Verrucomicrobiae bacterium]